VCRESPASFSFLRRFLLPGGTFDNGLGQFRLLLLNLLLCLIGVLLGPFFAFGTKPIA
jgi:hypothetical protein